VIPRIADHRIAGARKVLFCGAGDRGIERREYKIAIERGIEALDDQISRGFGNRCVEMPARGFRIGFAGGALGRGNFGELKPRVIGEEFYEALADEPSGAENACAPLPRRVSWQ